MYGWKEINGELHPIPMSDPAPQSLLDIQLCTCQSSKCVSRVCSCFKAGQLCTDACQCVGCGNRPEPPRDDSSSVLDDTTEDEGDEDQDESEEEVYDYSDDEIY